MASSANYTSDEAYAFSGLLRDVFLGRREQSSVASALHLSQQNFAEWLSDNRRNALCAVLILIEKLREFGNERADELFTALAQRLGFLSVRIVDEVGLSEQEHRALAEEASRAIDRLTIYREERLRLAAEAARHPRVA